MLNRRRTLLGLILLGNGKGRPPLSLSRLNLYAFLLGDGGGRLSSSSTYQFVPHSEGPFSFVLSRDLQALARDGYVTEDGSRGTYLLPEGMYSQARQEFEKLSSEARESIGDALIAHREMPTAGLVEKVLSEFPAYAVRVRGEGVSGQDMVVRPIAKNKVYTFGYEGRSVDSFFARLLRVGVRRIADVRKNAVSRVFGFARSSMARIACELGLEYVHFPQLGIPSDKRRELKSDQDYERLFDSYERDILPRESTTIEQLGDMMAEMPSVLVCMERDASRCHRARVAEALATQTGLLIDHL